MKQAQRDFVTALKSGDAVDRTLANHRFHALTNEMAANTYLRPSFQRLLIDHARIAVTFYQPRRPDQHHTLTIASDQHDAMIAAIEAGDANTAAALAEDHWALSRHQIERFVMPQALDAELGDTSITPQGAA